MSTRPGGPSLCPVQGRFEQGEPRLCFLDREVLLLEALQQHAGIGYHVLKLGTIKYFQRSPQAGFWLTEQSWYELARFDGGVWSQQVSY